MSYGRNATAGGYFTGRGSSGRERDGVFVSRDSPSDFDRVFLQDPMRDERPFWEHVMPLGLAKTLVKNGLLTSVIMMAKPQPPSIPEDPAALARFAAGVLWKPILKDIATTTCTRTYERAASVYFSDGSEVEAGRFVREPPKAAVEARRILQRSLDDEGFSLGSFLLGRLRLATHLATEVIPRPALIANLALMTVEQAEVLIVHASHAYRRRKVSRVLADRSAPAAEAAAARRELTELDAASTTPLLQAVTMRAVAAAIATLLEGVLGGVGTVLLPGWGTLAGQAIGSAGGWLLIDL